MPNLPNFLCEKTLDYKSDTKKPSAAQNINKYLIYLFKYIIARDW